MKYANLIRKKSLNHRNNESKNNLFASRQFGNENEALFPSSLTGAKPFQSRPFSIQTKSDQNEHQTLNFARQDPSSNLAHISVYPEQNSVNSPIQRVYYKPELNGYYSHALEGQKMDQNNAVFSAISYGGAGGGHTTLYSERVNKDQQENLQIDLFVEGGSGSEGAQMSSSVMDSSSGSSGSSGGAGKDGVTIEIQPAQEQYLDKLNGRPNKRSWVVGNSKVDDALNKAKEIQADQSKYSYSLLGVSPFKKKVLNCAKFGEIVLKAAGVNASAGGIFKLPSSLSKGKNVGYQKDQNYQEYLEEKRKNPQVKTQEEKLNQENYKNIPKGKHHAIFSPGKDVPGSYDPKGEMNENFTFYLEPLYKNEISLEVNIIVTDELKQNGRVQIVDGDKNFYVDINYIFQPKTGKLLKN